MTKGCHAFLNDEGKKIWGKIFPDGMIPVLSPMSLYAKLGEKEERVFMVAWDDLSPVQRALVIGQLAEKFHAPVSAVEAQILEKGMPLRACYVSATSIPARYF